LDLLAAGRTTARALAPSTTHERASVQNAQRFCMPGMGTAALGGGAPGAARVARKQRWRRGAQLQAVSRRLMFAAAPPAFACCLSTAAMPLAPRVGPCVHGYASA
jgi:hypothetical protein